MTIRRTAAAVITAVSSIVAVATAMPAQAAASRHQQPAGVYVAREGLASRGNQPASYVYDSYGGDHLVTVKPTSNGNGNVVYRTKKSGATKWTSNSVPGVRPLRHLHIEAHLSGNGSRVFVVFYQCNGVYVIDAPLRATRLQEPLLVKSEANCATGAADPYGTPSGVPEQRAAASYGSQGAKGDRLAILLYDAADLLPDATTPVGWTLYAGTPSAKRSGAANFSHGRSVLRADSALTPRQLAIDPRTLQPTVVATGTDGTQLAVFAFRGQSIYSPWPQPIEIATLGSPTANYTVESSLAFNRRVYVGLQRPSSFVHKSALYLVKSGSGGTWSGAFPLAHTGPTDSNLLIAKNTYTNNLHAAFTRHSGRHAGVMAEMQPKAGGWTSPASFSTSRLDRALALYVTPHGRNVIAYRHS